MGWRFVQQPNGGLARFSEIVDDFTDFDCTEQDAIEICVREHHLSTEDAKRRVQNAYDAGETRWTEALRIIRMVHGEQVAEERKRELSHDAEESER